jgi:hypothetical protein
VHGPLAIYLSRCGDKIKITTEVEDTFHEEPLAVLDKVEEVKDAPVFEPEINQATMNKIIDKSEPVPIFDDEGNCIGFELAEDVNHQVSEVIFDASGNIYEPDSAMATTSALAGIEPTGEGTPIFDEFGNFLGFAETAPEAAPVVAPTTTTTTSTSTV